MLAYNCYICLFSVLKLLCVYVFAFSALMPLPLPLHLGPIFSYIFVLSYKTYYYYLVLGSLFPTTKPTTLIALCFSSGV